MSEERGKWYRIFDVCQKNGEDGIGYYDVCQKNREDGIRYYDVCQKNMEEV